jgi:fructose-1,6-bisphosphatase/inositol monophosphatase family enzyme
VPETLARLAASAGSLRMLGSGTLALAWVAAGRLDASVLPDPAPWDRVPGSLLVTEAGGSAETVEGGAPAWHVAGAAPLLAELRGVLAPTRA